MHLARVGNNRVSWILFPIWPQVKVRMVFTAHTAYTLKDETSWTKQARVYLTHPVFLNITINYNSLFKNSKFIMSTKQDARAIV